MMKCRATEAPRLTPADAVSLFVDMFGAELENPDLAYLTISRAGKFGGGAHHYVELADQSFGQYDGISSLKLADDRRSLTLHLKYDVNGQGQVFDLHWAEPMDENSANWLLTFVAEMDRR